MELLDLPVALSLDQRQGLRRDLGYVILRQRLVLRRLLIEIERAGANRNNQTAAVDSSHDLGQRPILEVQDPGHDQDQCYGNPCDHNDQIAIVTGNGWGAAWRAV